MAEFPAIASRSSLPPVESIGSRSRALQSNYRAVGAIPASSSRSASTSHAPPSYEESVQNALLASGGLSRPGMDQSIPWRAPPGETDIPTYNWLDAPDTDVEDNDKVREPAYKMTQALPTIPGHERTGSKESKPVKRPPIQIPRNDRRVFRPGISKMSQREAKHALIDMTSHRCCYGNTAARQMDVLNIHYSVAAHYTLETFVESRTSKIVHIPYKGQAVDGPQRGTPPAMWNVVNEAAARYRPGVQTVRVPHSSTVEMCYACTGKGFNKCYRCKGRGRTKCKYCKARGQRGSKECEYCRGKGRQRCCRCNGHAVISCSVCEAYKQLEFFIEVTSKFIVKKDEYLHHADKRLPRKLLRGIDGVTLFEEEAKSVAPLANFPTVEVNSQSEKLVENHASVKTERLLLQRHKLVGVPIARVDYIWINKRRSYWLYGQQRKVYAPDYPQQCCCEYRCSVS